MTDRKRINQIHLSVVKPFTVLYWFSYYAVAILGKGKKLIKQMYLSKEISEAFEQNLLRIIWKLHL